MHTILHACKKTSSWFRYLVTTSPPERRESNAEVRVGVGRGRLQKEQLDGQFGDPVGSWGLRGAWGGERAVGRVQRPAARGQRSDPWPFILTCVCGKGSAMKIELKDLLSTLILVIEMGEMIVKRRKVKI